jgi:hypothetical protein
MIKSYTLSLMSVCLDQRKMALFQNYLLEYLQILAEYLDIEIYISLKIIVIYVTSLVN